MLLRRRTRSQEFFTTAAGQWDALRGELFGSSPECGAHLGARLDGAECLWAGLATHYLPGDRLAEASAEMMHQRVRAMCPASTNE